MKSGHIAILMISGITITSCSPIYTVNRYGVRAILIDGTNGTPIQRSPVTIAIDQATFERTTNRSGEMRVPPDRDLHWSWLGGPAWWSDHHASIQIKCAGFATERIEWARINLNQESPTTHSKALEEGGVINLGPVNLKKR